MFLEIDLGYPYNIRQKTERFPFAPGNKIINNGDFDEDMKKLKPKIIYDIKINL